MGPFGAGARLPSPPEPPKSQGKEGVVVALDFRNDKTFGTDVHILTDTLALPPYLHLPPWQGRLFRL